MTSISIREKKKHTPILTKKKNTAISTRKYKIQN